MTRIINARNVNYALADGLWHLKTVGVLGSSRNGPVLIAPGPVLTAYEYPRERVLWSSLRDANPFFHLFESMWMLAGRNDTQTLKPLVPRMQDFSDDQRTLNGAYGYRWREFFGYDQLLELSKLLIKDPSNRRCVLSMWNAMGVEQEVETGIGMMAEHTPPDLINQGSKDLPCNTHIYFDGSRGKLDMTVCCRSNDVIWGAYGANSVHMSFLHEWMAASVGLEMGTYYQMSNNYHIYIDRPDVKRLLDASPGKPRETWVVGYSVEDAYRLHPEHQPRLLLSGDEWRSAHYFLREMEDWCENGGYLERPVYSFTATVLNPVMRAHRLYKQGDVDAALRVLQGATPSDWRGACIRWLEKRIKHTNAAAV